MNRRPIAVAALACFVLVLMAESGCDDGKSSGTTTPSQRIGRGVEQPPATTATVTFQSGVDGYSGAGAYSTGSAAPSWRLDIERASDGTLIESAYMIFSDLSAVPAGASVVSASVRVYVYRENSCYGAPNDYLQIRPLTEAWTGSGDKTYIASPTPPAGDLAVPAMPDGTGTDPNVLDTPQALDIPITDTSVVQTWLDTPTSNNGFALVASAANDVMDLQLFSNDATNIPYRPMLTIVYTTDTNQSPACSISASVTSGDAPLTVTFTGVSSDPDGTISALMWDMDDGKTYYEPVVTYTYDQPGTYFVNFTVQDDGGKTTTDIAVITVTDPTAPPDYPSISYHPVRFPLKKSDESIAPQLIRKLPSSRHDILVWHDQIMYSPTAEVAQAVFAARNIVGAQKMPQNRIAPIRDRNPDFLVLQYHLAYGLTRESDWMDKNVWGTEKDEFDAWMAANSYGASVLQNVFLKSSLSTFQSSYDSPDWDVDYGIPGLLDGGLRYDADFYYVDIGYNPGGGVLWSRYISDETVRRMQMNDAGYNFDGTFFDTSTGPTSGLINCPSNWYTGTTTIHADNNDAFNTLWNTLSGALYDSIRTAYSSGHRYLILPNSNNMVSNWYDSSYLYHTDGAFIEHFSVSGNDTLAASGPGEWERSMGRIITYITYPKKVFCALPAFDFSASTALNTRKFVIASFLLVKNDTSYFSYNASGIGTPPNGNNGNPRWFPEYEIDIGSYLDDCPGSLDALRVEGAASLYARWYTGGVVLVNASQTVTYPFKLDRTYYPYDFSGGGFVALDGSKASQTLSTGSGVSDSIDVPPNTGIVLRVTPLP